MNIYSQTVMSTDLAGTPSSSYMRPKGSLLKWIGNKYKMVEEITSYFPHEFNTFYEVFLGGASILATVQPKAGVGSDTYGPLIEIWAGVKSQPEKVVEWYAERVEFYLGGDSRKSRYEAIKARFNETPNGPDFLFLCRSCYGGVIRFRKVDGYMSTPCGIHSPLKVETFRSRVFDWHERIKNTDFLQADYREVMRRAQAGDMVYCDPPYSDSQSILYGAQDFRLHELFDAIGECKDRGVFVALSIDGSKKSGNRICDVEAPEGLFERNITIQVGRSMLKRFQMNGRTLEAHAVTDRLLLTYI